MKAGTQPSENYPVAVASKSLTGRQTYLSLNSRINRT